jgi:orotidine-5'-phosphate decarboxylase
MQRRKTHKNLIGGIDLVMKDRLLFDKPGVIVACDVDSLEALRELVIKTCAVPGIIGYKLGAIIGLLGLKQAVDIIREYCTDTLIIYDHQKLGNDIPDMGRKYAAMFAQAGVDAAIIFPFAGPVTHKTMIEALREVGVVPIVGGDMTHEGFSAEDDGYLARDASKRIYTLAAELGVTNYVLPGNKLKQAKYYLGLLNELVGEGNFTVMSPGFITQGGKISDFAKLIGIWAAIVGRAIYDAKDMNIAAWNAVAPLGYTLKRRSSGRR